MKKSAKTTSNIIAKKSVGYLFLFFSKAFINPKKTPILYWCECSPAHIFGAVLVEAYRQYSVLKLKKNKKFRFYVVGGGGLAPRTTVTCICEVPLITVMTRLSPGRVFSSK